MKYIFLKLLNKAINIIFTFVGLFHLNAIKVLMMHEIISDNITPKSFELSNRNFCLLVDKLKYNGNVLSIEKFYNCFLKKEFNGEYLLTFDDVHESVYKYAFPLLTANSIPFTIFVNLSLLDKSGYIKTCQLVEMAQSDLCTVGSHGTLHVFFRNLTRKECVNQLNGSKLALERLIKKPVDFFAFPYGSLVACSVENINDSKLSKYKMSFSTISSGVWSSVFISRYFVPRINVTRNIIDQIK
ncbi:MAG: polysaccharide deacetylase family protein [Bacteroidales bacterium]